MTDSTHIALKVVVIVHFVLTVWGTLNFLNASYIYMNAFILSFGVWAIISPDSVDAVLMFFILNVLSIAMDIIFLGVWASMGENAATYGSLSSNYVNAYRFSLGMAILNLLFKPFTSFILYRLYQDRRGDVRFPAFGIGSNRRPGEYDPIGATPSAPYNYVETAAPHSTIEKLPTS